MYSYFGQEPIIATSLYSDVQLPLNLPIPENFLNKHICQSAYPVCNKLTNIFDEEEKNNFENFIGISDMRYISSLYQINPVSYPQIIFESDSVIPLNQMCASLQTSFDVFQKKEDAHETHSPSSAITDI